MKPPILMNRVGNRLAPLDAWSAEQLEALPERVPLNIRATKATARGDDEAAGLLRLWWAGINLLHEQTDDPKRQWPLPKHLSRHILKEIGFYLNIPTANGGTSKKAESISLDHLDDVEDRKMLFELARAYCVARWKWDPWRTWVEQQEQDRTANTRGFRDA